MRIPSFSYSNSLINQMHKLNGQQIKAQTQLATGQRISSAEEDPRAAGRALNTLTEKSRIQAQNTSLKHANTIAEFTMASYEQLKVLSNESSRLANNSDGLTSSSDYRARALQIDQLLEQSLRILNTKLGEDYVFAGANTAERPYVETRDAEGRITSVDYTGTSNPNQDVSIRIGEGANIAPYSKGAINAEIGDWVNNLVTLRDALQAEDLDAVNALAPQMEAADETILINLVEFGSIQQSMDITQKINTARFNELERMASSELDLDIAESIVRLNQMQTAYSAALQSSSRILQQSILNYI